LLDEFVDGVSNFVTFNVCDFEIKSLLLYFFPYQSSEQLGITRASIDRNLDTFACDILECRG
jgi:hypothetical protein